VVLSGTVPPGGVTVRWAIRREPRKSIADQAQEDQFPRGQVSGDQPPANRAAQASSPGDQPSGDG